MGRAGALKDEEFVLLCPWGRSTFESRWELCGSGAGQWDGGAEHRTRQRWQSWDRQCRLLTWQRCCGLSHVTVACHVPLSSWLWKTLFKQTAVYISMPVPVCLDSYFQSEALKHIWMSHYFWSALTATGKSKHYCLVRTLHSRGHTGVSCMGCILFLLHSHFFSVFIWELSYCARKDSPMPARPVHFSLCCKSTSA